ncbi:nicotinamide riboside kinase [Cotesia typhae]|uniref:nicotinamide riboside kinase n=1 Tax=Cotesia typhae TaxID=2053667 RepID=UPI003D68C63A
MARWLIVGIGGATCSGKTTLSKQLHEFFKNSRLINQDSYFLPEDDPRHVHIPELNHHNWDILTSLDTSRMYADVLKILSGSNRSSSGVNINCLDINKKIEETRVLVLDGFLIFKDKPIAELCNLKYFLTLTKQQCWERRQKRVYDPPDVPGYFDKVIWPEYERHLEDIKREKKICFIDGTMNQEEIFQQVLADISKAM